MSELFKDLVIDSESPSGLRWADTARRNRGKRVGALPHEGYFATLDEAAEVANKLREELHGHYARFR